MFAKAKLGISAFNLFGDCTDNSCDGTLLVLTGEMSCGALDRDPLYLASAEVTCFLCEGRRPIGHS